MAEYTKRAAEVFALVLEFVRWSQADADGYFSALSRTLPPAEYERVTEDAGRERDHFLKKTTEYFEARKGRLEALIAAVNDICKDAYERSSADPEARFRAPIDALLEDNRRILGSILSGLSAPTQKGVDLKLRLQREEEEFCGRLAAKRAPTCWARIARCARDLTELRPQLVEVWASLVRKTDEIDRLAEDAVTRMEETLRRAYDQMNEREKALQQGLADAARDLAAVRPDGGLDRARAAAEPVYGLLDRVLDEYARNGPELRAAFVTIGQSIYNLRALQEAEVRGIHRIYLDTRAQLVSFLREPTPDVAKAKLRESQELLGQWAGDMGPAGLKADAEDLGKELVRQLDAGMKAIDGDFSSFESENRGRFYDSLRREHAEALLLPEAWRKRAERIARYAPFKISYTLLPSSFDSAVGAPQAALLAALRAVSGQDAARDALVADLGRRHDELSRKARQLSTDLQTVVDEANRLFEGADFKGLFTREAVERSLRS